MGTSAGSRSHGRWRGSRNSCFWTSRRRGWKGGARGLTTAYGNIRAIREIDLAVPEGRIVCIIGANGAGKTTLLRTIAGLLRPAAGTITFLREEITALTPPQIVRRGIGLVPG